MKYTDINECSTSLERSRNDVSVFTACKRERDRKRENKNSKEGLFHVDSSHFIPAVSAKYRNTLTEPHQAKDSSTTHLRISSEAVSFPDAVCESQHGLRGGTTGIHNAYSWMQYVIFLILDLDLLV